MKKLLFLTAMLAAAAPFCHADEREIERKTARTLYELAPKNSHSGDVDRTAWSLALLGAYDAAKEVAGRRARSEDLDGSSFALQTVNEAAIQRAVALKQFARAKQLALLLPRREQYQWRKIIAFTQVRRGVKAEALPDVKALLGYWDTNTPIGDIELAYLLSLAGDKEAARQIFWNCVNAFKADPEKPRRYLSALDETAAIGLVAGLSDEVIRALEEFRRAHPQTEIPCLYISQVAQRHENWDVLEKLAELSSVESRKMMLYGQAAFVASLTGNKEKAHAFIAKCDLPLTENSVHDPNSLYAALILTGQIARANQLLRLKSSYYELVHGKDTVLLSVVVDHFFKRLLFDLPLSAQQLEQLRRLTDELLPVRNREDFGLRAVEDLTHLWLRLGDKKYALKSAIMLEQTAWKSSTSMSQRVEISRIFRDLGDAKRMNVWKKSALEEARKTFGAKDGIYRYAIELLRNGYVEQARSYVTFESWRTEKIRDYEWGSVEGSKVTRQNAKVAYVDWLRKMPKELKHRELMAYAGGIASSWRIQREISYFIFGSNLNKRP